MAKSSTAPKKTLSPAQIAAQLTWQLKGDLKNAQIAYLRVGGRLARIRDEKLYAALGHKDLEHYAAADLRLGRASLYRYLQVYDWVCTNHPAWLAPKPQGFIPDLSDVADLIWIEKELTKKRLSAKKKAALEALREKALKGELQRDELRAFRQETRRSRSDAIQGILATLRSVRRRMAKTKNVQPDWIAQIDTLIGMIEHQRPVDVAGLEFLGPWTGYATAALFS